MKTLYYLPILLCLSYAARSEEIEKDTTKIRNIELNEVVVQSFKQQRNLRLEPLSASAVTGTAIQNRNITGIKEFSSFIPNLFMPDYGSKLTSPVYIRGIGSKINAPSVGLYVDGIPYFEKSAFDFDFNEVDRIEVLRGPQGTLYGRNTMGGIINVYTKSPLKYEGTNVWLSNGSYGYRDYALSHYKKIGEKFGYAISGNYRNSDGYFTNLFTDKKADDMKSGSARIRLEWKPQKNLSLGLMSSFDRSIQGGYPYAVCDSATHKPGEVDYNDYSFYKRTLSTTGFSADYQGTGYSINSRTAFQYISDHQGIDQDFSPKSIYFARQDMKQKMFSEELNIKSTTPGRYKWLFGAFGFWQGIDNTVTKGYKTGGFNTSFDREEDRTFRPETSWNYELGAKHPFLDNRLNAEFCFFWIDWKNQQIYQMLATQNGQFLRNAGRSESKGVEVSLQGNPVNGLMVQVNYGFTHATFRDYKDERRGIDYSGNFLPMVPRYTFAVGADYTIPNPCRHIDRFTISANYTGTGRILWKEDNKVSQPYYGLLNAKVSATKDFITFAIWAKNMTGADYSAFYFETGGKGLAQKGRPFTIGGNIQLSF